MKQKSTQKKTLHSQSTTDICQRRHHPFFASSSFINLTNLSIEHPLYALDTPIRQCLVSKLHAARDKKFGLKEEKELIFVRDFYVSPTHHGLKDAATHVEEFLKAWTVQAKP
jgi:hypothetical protein